MDSREIQYDRLIVALAERRERGVDSEKQAERRRALIRLRADCETVLERLDEHNADDVTLTVKIGDLCDALDAKLRRVAAPEPRPSPARAVTPLGFAKAGYHARAEARVPR